VTAQGSRSTFEVDDPRGRTYGPADRPRRPRFGPLNAAVELVRLPADLVVAVGYTVRELPLLVQDLRSVVNDLARLADGGRSSALNDVLEGLGRAAGPDGALTDLLRAAADLAAARAEREEQMTVDTH
jgi:hypothetical protein